MPQQCTVCNHPQLEEIEKKIVQGKPNTKIADQYNLNHQAIRRHGNQHLPRRLVLAQKRKEQQHNETILEHLDGIVADTKDILDDAIEQNDKRLALKAIKESRNNMELLSKIAVKQAEYEQKDQAKENRQQRQALHEGIKNLTTDEIKTLLFLQAKINEADGDYIADSTSRQVIDYVNSDRFNGPNTDTNISKESKNPANSSNENDDKPESHLESDKAGNNDDSDKNVARNRDSEVKTSQNNNLAEPKEKDSEEDDLMLDDLSGLDLDDTDDNQIPSEETDPDWR